MSNDNLQNAFETLTARIGEQTSQSEWFEITQSRVNDFADVTMDHQWIHVDVDRASDGPFGAPIAHGHLTRTTSSLRRVEIKGGMIETMNEVVVEVEGQEKPACVAESLGRMVF